MTPNPDTFTTSFTTDELDIIDQAINDHSIHPINDQLWACRKCRITFPVEHLTDEEYRAVDEHVTLAILEALRLAQSPAEKKSDNG